ncbi:NarK family nitrate/nitrite MFS transporter [Selenomonas sp. TAMA-11512]|uniref:MFS transporter n=1 Tax=Selenomonas sp. TAMA-11512 TaxID=3095337 RepID=UPI003087C32A|nr:NarK family nitrate/nitrite MFS transporter [Selenomonas sp. TAMA-11512]
MSISLGENPSRAEILKNWQPEDPVFWEKYGKKIAKQNLYTSTWALTLAFCVWTLWATIAANLRQVGFQISEAEIFSLAALPGLVGATCRLFYTYMPGILGGRTWTFISTALFLLPLIGLSQALQDTATSYETLTVYVALLGLAGGNFSSSLANIGHFFPIKEKGLALGINGGIGNLGVSLVYFVVPFVIGYGIFGSLSDPGQTRTDGTVIFLQNACYLWLIATIITLFLIVKFMDNLPMPKQSPRSMVSIFGLKHTWIITWIYTCAFGSFIGYSFALGLLSSKEFPEIPITYAAFLGPLIGATMRTVGGWLADRINSGSKVTFASLIGLFFFSIMTYLGIETHRFPIFFGGILAVFLCVGLINGASFRMIPHIIPTPIQASLVTGFSAAIAAYGGFFIPKLFNIAYAEFNNAAPAFYVLIIYTAITIAVTWWFYRRSGSIKA